MKRFVFRVVSFVLLVVLTIGGLCALEVAAELRQYRRELKAQPEAAVFVCGDSRTELGLNPSRWPALFNFSASARTLDQTYLTAADILAANSNRFQVMIVDVSPEGMCHDYGLSVGEMGSASQYLLLYLLHRGKTSRSMSGVLGTFRDFIVDHRMHHLSRVVRGKTAFRSSLAGGYQRKEGCLKQKSPLGFAQSVEGWRVRTERLFDDPSAVAGRYFAILDRIVGLARDCGVEVVLITAPWHADLRARVGSDRLREFARTVRGYAELRGCRYLDGLNLLFPEDCWCDENHLNGKGSDAFTDFVRRWLEEESHGQTWQD